MGRDVLPSVFRVQRANPHRSHASRVNNDGRLRFGVVVAAYDPQDDQNFSKKVYEYDVEVLVSNGQTIATSVVYPRCRLDTRFGGLADKCVWAPRVQVKNKDGSIKEPGSQVLLECVNGLTRQAVIIGGMEPTDIDEQSQDFKKGPRFQWQYNGVDILINKDGEVTLTRLGPTTNEGKPKDDNDKKVKASLQLDKDGQVIVKTGDDKQVITMSLDDGKIVIDADKGVEINVQSGKVVTMSTGVELGGSSEHLILGDNYISAEDSFMQAFSTFLNQLSGVAGTLSGAVIEPAVIAAAPQLTAAVLAFTIQLQQFKAKLSAKTVLSKKNTTE